METIFKYESPSVALEVLTGKGYIKDYNIEFETLLHHVDDFVIDYLYRYEGPTDPSDESTVYGLRDIKNNEKGVFVVGDLSQVEGKKREILLNLEIKSKSHE